jgi:DNA invertase Pin-like site-specific DNA recombinase
VLRAIGYTRVSTMRQAEHEVSLAEQQEMIQSYCALRRAEVVRIFVEPGASALSDSRPVFQEMVRFACDPANGIGLVVVYAFSRFFRNVAEYLRYKNILKDSGVRLVSATQDLPEGPHGELMETILAAFDGHQSETNAETVRQVMAANAETGYWNGSRPPERLVEGSEGWAQAAL